MYVFYSHVINLYCTVAVWVISPSSSSRFSLSLVYIWTKTTNLQISGRLRFGHFSRVCVLHLVKLLMLLLSLASACSCAVRSLRFVNQNFSSFESMILQVLDRCGVIIIWLRRCSGFILFFQLKYYYARLNYILYNYILGFSVCFGI